MNTYKGLITGLDPHEIFVFGANTESRHGKGAALVARQKFGAKYGVPHFCEQSYGIITKDLTKSIHPSVSPEFIKNEIKDLYEFATTNPNLHFYVAYSGSGTNLSGYTPKQMASFFASYPIPDNFWLEEEFANLM